MKNDILDIYLPYSSVNMEQERDGEGKGVNEQAYVTIAAQLYKY